MTIHTPVPKIGPPDETVSEALVLFEIASAVMRQLIDDAKAEDPQRTAREMAVYTKELRDALRLIVQEKLNAEKLRRDAGDLAAGREFDLDAARDEVGRRLACLRDAGPD